MDDASTLLRCVLSRRDVLRVAAGTAPGGGHHALGSGPARAASCPNSVTGRSGALHLDN